MKEDGVRYSAACWRAECVPAAGGSAGLRNPLVSGSGWSYTSPGGQKESHEDSPVVFTGALTIKRSDLKS